MGRISSSSYPCFRFCARHCTRYFTCIIHSTHVTGGQLSTRGMAVSAVNVNPLSSHLFLPPVTWASVIIPTVQRKTLELREMSRPKDKQGGHSRDGPPAHAMPDSPECVSTSYPPGPVSPTPASKAPGTLL